jgi:hypothetical protein
MPWHSLRTAAVSCSFVMMGMANGLEVAVEAAVEATRSAEVSVGSVVDDGGACDDGDREADGGAPDITDTKLIGFRIVPGISHSACG